MSHPEVRKRPIKIIETVAVSGGMTSGTARHTVASVATREAAERWIAAEMKRCPWRMLSIKGGVQS